MESERSHECECCDCVDVRQIGSHCNATRNNLKRRVANRRVARKRVAAPKRIPDVAEPEWKGCAPEHFHSSRRDDQCGACSGKECSRHQPLPPRGLGWQIVGERSPEYEGQQLSSDDSPER